MTVDTFMELSLKAAGFNAASLYFHWGLTEQKQGELNFDYYRSQADAYEVAKEVGILIISRPGVSDLKLILHIYSC